VQYVGICFILLSFEKFFWINKIRGSIMIPMDFCYVQGIKIPKFGLKCISNNPTSSVVNNIVSYVPPS
jgi:hypothetical protein